AIRDGDTVVFDIDQRTLSVELSDGEIAARVAAWPRPEPRFATGVMAKYARLVTSAATGAVTG
ncbi:MAG: dihydroxy-acid dehydratase, partial [Myxococcota bacterium]|nr:dihydroxy-acid dehydratase [Myxococcota bacterium]